MDYLGAHASASHKYPCVNQCFNGPAHVRTGHSDPLGELDLVAQLSSWGEIIGFDRTLNVLGDLKIERQPRGLGEVQREEHQWIGRRWLRRRVATVKTVVVVVSRKDQPVVGFP